MKNKVALVTGASRGIGRGIALELAKHGVLVAVNYHANEKLAVELVAEINEIGGDAVPFQADISRVSEVRTLFDEVIKKFGCLDFLVNNAGIMKNRPILEVTEDEFDQVMTLNVKGLFFCCQQGAEKIKDGGRIINIGSTVTRVMLPSYGTYAASKGAVEQLTKVLAKELGHRSVTVNTVSPGPTDTELFRYGKSEEQIAALGAMSAFNRVAQASDIARVVSMLCSDDSSWITGQNILANGGFIA